MGGLQDTGPATEQQTLFRDMESGKPTSPLMISLGYVFIRVFVLHKKKTVVYDLCIKQDTRQITGKILK